MPRCCSKLKLAEPEPARVMNGMECAPKKNLQEDEKNLAAGEGEGGGGTIQ